MFIASISVFGVLLINESCRSSVKSIFKYKEVLSAELNEYFDIVNERMQLKSPILWNFDADKM